MNCRSRKVYEHLPHSLFNAINLCLCQINKLINREHVSSLETCVCVRAIASSQLLTTNNTLVALLCQCFIILLNDGGASTKTIDLKNALAIFLKYYSHFATF